MRAARRTRAKLLARNSRNATPSVKYERLGLSIATKVGFDVKVLNISRVPIKLSRLEMHVRKVSFVLRDKVSLLSLA